MTYPIKLNFQLKKKTFSLNSGGQGDLKTRESALSQSGHQMSFRLILDPLLITAFLRFCLFSCKPFPKTSLTKEFLYCCDYRVHDHQRNKPNTHIEHQPSKESTVYLCSWHPCRGKSSYNLTCQKLLIALVVKATAEALIT